MAMSMFLTNDEIQRLTGYKRPADQLRWLLHRGWLYELNAANRPIVLRSYADRKLSGNKQTGSNQVQITPNFAAVNG